MSESGYITAIIGILIAVDVLQFTMLIKCGFTLERIAALLERNHTRKD